MIPCPSERRAIHVVSFDVPYPADYGGVIDVFYKIKSLYETGWRIHLHCFAYGRTPQPRLERYCERVYYYHRRKLCNPFDQRPYIVSTRANDLLLKRLQTNDWPILFEGLHTAFYGGHPALQDRHRILRTHNIEHVYYHHLARVEDNPLRKWFFRRESERLRAFESVAAHFDTIAAISPADHQRMQLKYGNSRYVPVFHPHREVHVLPGEGSYVLYHGNLRVGENREAALYLIQQIFSKLSIPLVIAGKNPGKKIVAEVQKHRNVRLVPNPDEEQMRLLVRQAQAHVLPTFQNTGIKLKLLQVMFNGRHVLANKAMVQHTGLEPFTHLCTDAPSWRRQLEDAWETPITRHDLHAREQFLQQHFNNRMALERLLGHAAEVRPAYTSMLSLKRVAH